MYRRENECVDCGLPCMGNSCPNRNVLRLYCDRCGEETNELFHLYTDDDLCADCLVEEAEPVTCYKCGDHTTLYEYDGKLLCDYCLRNATRFDDFDD